MSKVICFHTTTGQNIGGAFHEVKEICSEMVENYSKIILMFIGFFILHCPTRMTGISSQSIGFPFGMKSWRNDSAPYTVIGKNRLFH
jgi:hypothetical protein